MTSAYFTGKGDAGHSGLFGSAVRIPKHDPIFELLGTLDELNSWLGLCRELAASENPTSPLSSPLEETQQALFILQAQVAGADKRLNEGHIGALEKAIAELTADLTGPEGFYLAGGCLLSAHFDVARTVVRRTERTLLTIAETRIIPGLGTAGAYLNRLSSLLYAMVRYANQRQNVSETAPSYAG